MTEDLVARVLAAIDETERIAQAAEERHPSPWRADRGPGALGLPTGTWLDDSENVGAAAADGSHMAAHLIRQDPHAVLRRCAADRKIVAEVCGLSVGVLKHDLVASLGDLVLSLLAEGYGIATEETDDECE